MKITCQSCQSKYTVSDEKVQGKTVKIKCRKCGATILVSNSPNGAVDPSSSGGDGTVTYQVNVAENDQRTMSLAEVVAAYNESVITGETYVWADGMDDWKPLAEVEGIVSALSAPAAAPATPATISEPAPAAAAAAPRAAARKDPARKSADLFGGGMAAQTAADDVATSAPLFSASAHAAPVAPAAATGQRDENSTLFSLSALTAKAGAPASPSKGSSSKEDSGLIDLKALAASAGSAPVAAPAASLLGDSGGLFPLGVPLAAAPAAAAPVIQAPVAAPKNNTPLIIGVGVLVAVAAAAGAFFATKGGGDAPAASAQVSAQAAPSTPPSTPTAAAPATAAAPSATAAAEAPSAEASAAAKAGGHAGHGGRPAAGGGGRPPPAAPPPAAGPKRGKCGCPPGDLMCAMKCSTGK